MNSIIRALIIEDDVYSRAILRGMLNQCEGIDIVEEIDNGNEAMGTISVLEPQVLFIDIDLPGVNGMEIAKEVVEKYPDIFIIFVTGHANFAVESYDLASFDYIVKPFELDRIKQTVRRLKDRVRELSVTVEKLAQALRTPDKLFIKYDHELYFIDTDEIYFIERDKNKRKTIVYTAKKKYETSEPLSAVESRLSSNRFFRSHKSFLVNLSKVERISPWGDSYLIQFMGTDLEAYASKNKMQLLYESLNI